MPGPAHSSGPSVAPVADPAAGGTTVGEHDGARLVRTLELAAEACSASRSRQFVSELLVEAGRERWNEAACLAVSELVTNAVLHAHTRIDVTAVVLHDQMRIEVRDYSPVLPSSRTYDEQATTGRGLELVASLTAAHGVQSLGSAGKIVWCCIGDTDPFAGMSVDDLLAIWDDDADVTGDETAGPAQADACLVILQGMPATLWLAAREHQDALLRELALLHATADLAAADEARFIISTAVDAEVQRARDSGAAVVPLPQDHPGTLPPVPVRMDLQVRVRPQQAECFARLQDVLDEGERLATAGRLLLRPGLPEIIAVRDWACEQVIAQLAGSPPAPWHGTHDDRYTSDVDGSALPSDWDHARITQAPNGMIAVDEANRIIAVSVPLTQVLGWAAEELVGRRVVAIIPPAYREAHVAGFSRHLSTGEARAIGINLRLPVLRADGAEVECHFLIESESTPSGRNVYVASITPAEPARN